jgi:TolA-binding protein
MPDRVERLRAAAQARHAATLRRAEAALRALASRREVVSLRGLATAAGVSRSWLYRQPELRKEVERLRRRLPAHKHSMPSDQQATVESLRQQLRAYREEIARLRVENQALKDQVARDLGAARAASVTERF